ncbi:MAG TPA: long-chain fatty acid--CoA ligase [Acidobacteriota bacterium]|nr:long-chain fatty acid--CoA ligase [Acidobacteriota bacterium]
MPRATDIIDPKTAGTIAGLFRERVRRTPYASAYRYFNVEEHRFKTMAWSAVFRRAARWQGALERENLRPGDRVAVILRNCPEWMLFDVAALGLGLITVPIFADDRPANIAHILKESGSRFVLLEEEALWRSVEEEAGLLSEIERIVALHPASSSRSESDSGGALSRTNTKCDSRVIGLESWLPEIDREYRVNCRDAAELATIVYTSGTTGMPKGVMLSHGNILENAFACLQAESIYPEDVFLSFLPLSHTFERTVGYYIPMMAGACVAYVRSIDKLSEDLLEVRPTVLISVPRIYERIHKKIAESLENKPLPLRLLFRLTVHTGWQRFLHLQRRRRWTPLLLLWPILNRVVARRLTSGLGGRLRLSISGGAPLAFPIARVFIGLGLNLLQGYGLTETSPVISFNTSGDNIPTTVGCPLPGVESAIAADGELLVRGPSVMLGYWRNGTATEAVIDSEGYFHTGDLARRDEGGHLTIVGRIKEILVLSTGEKISPGDLELAIAVNPLFEQVMVVGEGRPYLVALVVLNRRRWESLAADHGIAFEHLDLLDDEKVERILLSEIARQVHHFQRYAQIRRVHASFTPWSAKEGLITHTLKLRRKELLARFIQEVASLFKGH